jgi:hypothetical protein
VHTKFLSEYVTEREQGDRNMSGGIILELKSIQCAGFQHSVVCRKSDVSKEIDALIFKLELHGVSTQKTIFLTVTSVTSHPKILSRLSSDYMRSLVC